MLIGRNVIQAKSFAKNGGFKVLPRRKNLITFLFCFSTPVHQVYLRDKSEA